MKLQKIRYTLIGLGFLGIFFSTIVGGLLGAKINTALLDDCQSAWLQGLEKSLLVSAHSHLNLMSVICVLFGLSIQYLWGNVHIKIISLTVWINLVSAAIFVLGLFLKAFWSDLSVFSGVITLGAIGYIISIGIYSSLFIARVFKNY